MTSQQKIELCLRASLLARESLNVTEHRSTGGLVISIQMVRKAFEELEAFARKVVDEERELSNASK